MTRPLLAWIEHGLPGVDLDGRIAVARAHGLALEVAHRPGTDLRAVVRSDVPVATLQAYGMHEAHPIHPDPAVRSAGLAHLRDAVATAARLGIPRVLAVCGYGRETCAEPFESCLGCFAAAKEDARAGGVRILVEPLSPLRAAAMAGPEEVERLLDALDARDVFGLAIDTGHLLDASRDVESVLAGLRHAVDEIQLRGRGSVPPGPELPLERWMACAARPPSVLCVEHRGTVEPAALGALVERLGRI